jgi:thiol-disulfide isomerase/thioredoxin
MDRRVSSPPAVPTRRPIRLASLAIATMFAGLAGLAGCGDDAESAGPVIVSGIDPGDACPQPSPSGVLSTDKNDFVLPALCGDGQVRLADFRGTPLVVNLFASWCGPCEKELPAFHRVSVAAKGQVAFVGVNSKDEGNGYPLAVETGVTDWPLARDTGGNEEEGLLRSLGARGLPVTVFYNADGTIAEIDFGELDEAKLIAKLTELFGVELTLDER